MSDKKPENPPAFPSCMNETCGLSLRDYFAAYSPLDFTDAVNAVESDKEETFAQLFYRLAKMRYAYADAMLAARGKK